MVRVGNWGFLVYREVLGLNLDSFKWNTRSSQGITFAGNIGIVVNAFQGLTELSKSLFYPREFAGKIRLLESSLFAGDVALA